MTCARTCTLIKAEATLVHLLHCGATGTTRSGTSTESAWHITFRSSTTARCLVVLHHDGIHRTLQLLLLGLKLVLLSKLILVEPIKCVLHGLLNLLLVTILKLFLELFLLERVAHGEAIIL